MKVLIEAQELLQLLERDWTLAALEGAGVDNWDFYGECFDEEYCPPFEDTLETLIQRYQEVKD